MPAIGFIRIPASRRFRSFSKGGSPMKRLRTKGIIEPGGVNGCARGRRMAYGGAVGTARIKGYQLWIALPPEMESIEPKRSIRGEHFQCRSGARHPGSPRRRCQQGRGADDNQLPGCCAEEGRECITSRRRITPSPGSPCIKESSVREIADKGELAVSKVECCPGIRSPCRYGIHPRFGRQASPRPRARHYSYIRAGRHSTEAKQESRNREAASGGRPSLGR